jgi:sensor c-di-GMP phosphodiesterase-like protein
MIIGLGRALNLRIVAEGVETGGQLEALREMGCDVAQGFLFMRPVPDWCIDELLDLGPRSSAHQETLVPLQAAPVEGLAALPALQALPAVPTL